MVVILRTNFKPLIKIPNSMKKLILLASFLLLTFQTAFAEVYSWEDSSGSLHFGNTPPASATKVKKVANTTVSKYSSNKLLKPLQTGITSRTETAVTLKPKANQIPETQLINQDARASLKEETLTLTELERGNLNIKYNKTNDITTCSITLKNTSSIPAANVLVTFEFEDGTLIPATGSDSIAPDSSANYEIPDDMLPISIRGFSGTENKPIPKVEIKVGG